MRARASCLIIVAITLVGAFITTTHSVHAVCSIAAPQELERGVLVGVEYSDLVLVGRVTSETSMGRIQGDVLYESVIEPLAVLRGESPQAQVIVPFLGSLGSDCSGGPRMKEGEYVLVALSWNYLAGTGDGSREYAWQLHDVYSKVLLQDGEAISQTDLNEVVLGQTIAVVQTVARAAGASEAQTDAAVAAASRSMSFDSSRSWYWAVLPVAIAGFALGTVVIYRMRR